jgi:hypothetical protein
MSARKKPQRRPFTFVRSGHTIGCLSAVLVSCWAWETKAQVICTSPPGALGAVVASADRCAFFKHYRNGDAPANPILTHKLNLQGDQKVRSIAVIVGIAKYKNPDYNLPSAAGDVDALRASPGTY